MSLEEQGAAWRGIFGKSEGKQECTLFSGILRKVSRLVLRNGGSMVREIIKDTMSHLLSF